MKNKFEAFVEELFDGVTKVDDFSEEKMLKKFDSIESYREDFMERQINGILPALEMEFGYYLENCVKNGGSDNNFRDFLEKKENEDLDKGPYGILDFYDFIVEKGMIGEIKARVFETITDKFDSVDEYLEDFYEDGSGEFIDPIIGD